MTVFVTTVSTVLLTVYCRDLDNIRHQTYYINQVLNILQKVVKKKLFNF